MNVCPSIGDLESQLVRRKKNFERSACQCMESLIAHEDVIEHFFRFNPLVDFPPFSILLRGGSFSFGDFAISTHLKNLSCTIPEEIFVISPRNSPSTQMLKFIQICLCDFVPIHFFSFFAFRKVFLRFVSCEARAFRC